MASAAQRTYYEILGVLPTANTGEIRAAYRKLVSQVHPDHGGSAAIFGLVNDAYETLSDPSRRKVYDESLESPYTSNTDSDTSAEDAGPEWEKSDMSGATGRGYGSNKSFTSHCREAMTAHPAETLLGSGIALSCLPFFTAPVQNLGFFVAVLGVVALIGRVTLVHRRRMTGGVYIGDEVTGLALLRQEILIGIPVSASAIGALARGANHLFTAMMPRRASGK